MKAYPTEKIRNVAIAGHTGGGKTSLTEAILWSLKQSERLGKTDDGNTISDYDPEEIRRHHSIQASLLPAEYAGHKINLLDLPGFRDFIGEIKGGIRAADATLLVFDATGGVETGAESVLSYAAEFKRPVAIFINKLDKDYASFDDSLAKLKDALDARLVPLTLPVGEAAEFKGVVDLIKLKFLKEGGQDVACEDVPAEVAEVAAAARAELMEMAAEGDEELLEKFLVEETLSPEEIIKGLGESFADGGIMPVLCGSATGLMGVRPVIDFIAGCVPDPSKPEGYPSQDDQDDAVSTLKVSREGPTVLHVFKTISDPFVGHLTFFKVLRGTAKGEMNYQNVKQSKNERFAHLLSCKGKKSENVESLAAGDIGAVAKLDSTRTGDTLIEPGSAAGRITPLSLPKPTAFVSVLAKSRADEDKIGMGFHRLIEQDPTLSLNRDATINQTILSGMGETHLAVAIGRLKDLTKIEVDMEPPRVPYLETITKKAEGQGKYKKQSGGHGQYGDCWVRFEPLPEGSGFEFDWKVVGGVIPTNFQSAVEKGLVEAMRKGVLSGHTTVDVKATCYDGTHHSVDSSDMAFKVAASMAFKNIIPHCGPVILEPIYKTKITIPEEYMGDVMGDLNSRRGRILGMNPEGKKQVIEALVPLSELYTYVRQLNSLSQGRGVFEMGFDHYERVPNEIQDKIIAQSKAPEEG